MPQNLILCRLLAARYALLLALVLTLSVGESGQAAAAAEEEFDTDPQAGVKDESEPDTSQDAPKTLAYNVILDLLQNQLNYILKSIQKLMQTPSFN